MDSPIISRLFRQLFTHRPCQSLCSHSSRPLHIHSTRHIQQRCYAARARKTNDETTTRNESHWQQRSDVFSQDMLEEYKKYPMVTADQLRGRRERPRKVKMLTRDFIEGMFRLRDRYYNYTNIVQTLSTIRHMATSRNKS